MSMKACILKFPKYPYPYPFLKKLIFFLILLPFFFTGCTPVPQPIEFGTDICHYCKMTIVDQRYGAEVVTNKGKVYKYDATECMVNSVYADKLIPEEKVHSFLTVAYDQPRSLIPVSEGHFLQSATLPSPMGMFLTCFSSKEELQNATQQHDGVMMDWDGVKQVVLENKRP